MRLQTVEITDILSIKGKLPIQFDKRVTILLGSNDHGKTNILNAIQHLNDDRPISQEEVNWDAKDIPAISFMFTLDPDESSEWKSIVEGILKEREQRAILTASPEEGQTPSTDQAPSPGSEGTVSVSSFATTTTPAAVPASPEDRVPASALDPSAKTLTLSRSGVGAPLQFADIPISELPTNVGQFLMDKKPRVEFFKLLGGNLQDSATPTTINTDEYEFLQGIFFYAGIDPRQSESLFNQDDETIRALDIASRELDSSLRRLWAQGTELHFELRHQSGAILFLADDPAIKSRKARMSKRSDGVTQFFRVSMVLYSRQRKNPASSYIYLFDEPGVLLHPQGQRDLIQVFEELAGQSQIVYATHSLFMLNQNFPERHRLIFKNGEGTKVDHKPFSQNWKLATDALGVYLSSNILFSKRVLLVEGDSDPIYFYELFRQLNRLGDIDVDINMLGIMSFYDYQNLRFLLQVFKREGQEAAVLVLADGDEQGKTLLQRVAPLCKRLEVPTHRLPDGRSVEDYCLFDPEFLSALKRTLVVALEAEAKPVPNDLDKTIQESWEKFRAPGGNAESKTAGRWFKDLATGFLGDEASKVALARYYTEACRELQELKPSRQKQQDAKTLCQEIVQKLSLPPIRATKGVEATH